MAGSAWKISAVFAATESFFSQRSGGPRRPSITRVTRTSRVTPPPRPKRYRFAHDRSQGFFRVGSRVSAGDAAVFSRSEAVYRSVSHRSSGDAPEVHQSRGVHALWGATAHRRGLHAVPLRRNGPALPRHVRRDCHRLLRALSSEDRRRDQGSGGDTPACDDDLPPSELSAAGEEARI